MCAKKREFRGDSLFDRPLEPVVVEYTQRLKGLYLLMRKRYDPSYICVASKEELLLTKLGRILYDEGVDPSEYVRFCFMEYYVERLGVVYVSMMMSQKALSEFREGKPLRDQALRGIVATQCRYLEGWLAGGKRDIRAILTDPLYSLSAVMRYAVAKAYGLTDLLPLFEEEARTTVRFSPGFFALLGEFLPREWKDDGAAKSSGSSGAVGADGPSSPGPGSHESRSFVPSKYGFQSK